MNPVKDEPWRKRDILDHTLIKRAANELKYLQQERGANRLWVLGNLADRTGRVKPENSMRIVHNALSKHIGSDQSVVFVEDAVIKDFEGKKENEVFPEQTTFVLENLNFKPDEFGYVEPEKPVEDPAIKAAAEEEARRVEEEKKQAAAAQAKGGAPAKAGAPADKKKEEELKKKAEEEAAAAKRAQELAQTQKSISPEEAAELQRQKEEADRKKREAEYFDYRTIH